MEFRHQVVVWAPALSVAARGGAKKKEKQWRACEGDSKSRREEKTAVLKGEVAKERRLPAE